MMISPLISTAIFLGAASILQESFDHTRTAPSDPLNAAHREVFAHTIALMGLVRLS